MMIYRSAEKSNVVLNSCCNNAQWWDGSDDIWLPVCVCV